MTTNIDNTNTSRRNFLRILGWGSFFTTLGVSSVGFIRFLYPNVLFEKPSTFTVGSLDEFKLDKTANYQVYENWKAEHSVWIVREKNRIYAVQAKCTHLGCTPNYFAEEGIFKCPCHGSRFRFNGENLAGPAPRPLDRLAIYIGNDGQIIVDKSRGYTFKEFNKKGAYAEV
ncbi:MAG: ubiquinol-cytochrome c reductase iron-sulfur subunit [Nitrospirae bacterium]|nr:ubiquinol-cytochrome c reductase iron-sulfur subunit [Nitrospirota bacterium]